MRLFAIDNDNNITAFPAAEQIPEGQEHFASEKELAKLAASWPGDRLLQIWNSFAGVAPFDELKPVKKFTDRKSAVARIWKAIQRLDAPAAPQAADVAPKAKRSRKAAKAEAAGAHGARRQQEGHRHRPAQTPGRRVPQGHYGGDRLAGAQRARLYLRQPHQENGPQRRVL